MFTDGRMTYREQHDAGQHEGKPVEFCGQCINAAHHAKPLPASLRDVRSAWNTSTRVYEALGIRSRTIPPDMAGDFIVDGHRVRILPARRVTLRREATGLQGWRRRRVGFSHRIYFVVPAPHGTRLIPMGRIHQAKF